MVHSCTDEAEPPKNKKQKVCPQVATGSPAKTMQISIERLQATKPPSSIERVQATKPPSSNKRVQATKPPGSTERVQATQPPGSTEGVQATKPIEKVKASKPKKKPVRVQEPVQSKPPQATMTSSSATPLAVQLPRSQLRGCFGLPFSGEVQVLESGIALQSGFAGELVSLDAGVASGDVQFAIAPGVTEKEIHQKGIMHMVHYRAILK